MKTGLLAIFGMTVLMMVTACVDFGVNVYGSGTPASESRTLENFDQVVVTTSADVRITGGEAIKCEVSGDDNIVPLIMTEVTGGQLRIWASDSFSSQNPVTVTLEVPVVTKVTVKGSGDVEMADVTKDTAHLAVLGSGNVTARGSVGQLTARVYGSGDVRLAELEARTADVSIKGSGDSQMWVNGESLNVSVAGSGNTTAKGNVQTLTVGLYGSGDARMAELETKTADVKVAGSGNADIWATESLTAVIKGSGDVRYKGEPKEVKTTVSGSGAVEKRG